MHDSSLNYLGIPQNWNIAFWLKIIRMSNCTLCQKWAKLLVYHFARGSGHQRTPCHSVLLWTNKCYTLCNSESASFSAKIWRRKKACKKLLFDLQLCLFQLRRIFATPLKYKLQFLIIYAVFLYFSSLSQFGQVLTRNLPTAILLVQNILRLCEFLLFLTNIQLGF